MENNQPSNPSWMMILLKWIIWIVVWIIFSLVVFLAFVWLAGPMKMAAVNAWNNMPFTPLVWLSFMGIALLTSIAGSFIISIIYNLLWQDEYYDIKIMSSWILTSNLLLLLIFLFFYIYVGSFLSDMDTLYVVYGFHLFFSIFISFTIMDIIKNPNYSPVYIIWNAFGFVIALLLFFILYSIYSWKGTESKNMLFYLPILAFSMIPFIATVWEKMYYKFYEMWNDFLYVPSLTEVLVDEEEIDEVNVEID